MEITIYAIIIWVTAILIISLDTVIIIGSKNLSSRVFAILSFITAIWVISQGFLVSSLIPEFTILLLRIQYILGIIIAIGFYFFSDIYPYDKKPTLKSLIFPIIIILIFSYLYFFTNYILSGVHPITSHGRWAWEFGPLHLLFDISFYTLWIISLYKIFRTYKLSEGYLRSNLKNMFWALTLGIIPPTMANILLPSLGIFHFNWLGPITSSIWIFILAYSIIRYRQMNVKTVITEVLALGMTTVFFINIFTNVSTNIYLRIIIFLTFIILAIYLIRSSLLESLQKEQLKILNLHLEEKVAEQTQAVKDAYELEKKARRELEKLNETKDQFIMITQHNLRTPVTSIKWELESMLSGSHGEISEEIKNTLLDTQTSANHLSRIVDDFLNITALKTGSQILNLEKVDMRILFEDILKELRIDIKQMNIRVDFPTDKASWPTINIDQNKIREVLLIIIENAVKYNIPNGTIIIKNRVENQIFEMTITNTGVGITVEDHRNLFNRLFYRGKRAQITHPVGMGIGLSVARAIARAHHGDITISSAGENMGAEVVLSLPLDFLEEVNKEIDNN
jgi:signal transduction histidine kinase